MPVRKCKTRSLHTNINKEGRDKHNKGRRKPGQTEPVRSLARGKTNTTNATTRTRICATLLVIAHDVEMVRMPIVRQWKHTSAQEQQIMPSAHTDICNMYEIGRCPPPMFEGSCL